MRFGVGVDWDRPICGMTGREGWERDRKMERCIDGRGKRGRERGR
jgi:hypothetical protein